ncbi:hypothetical protein [Pedobacter montanisoli]|uniref:Lipoprotein n=1 Tax=Pedobacter montanisoli TaxID=2923277 RepID=A0ABS9ZT18_9SPHI|nr:hypothetical protein [Pedobacter montanisoli]MCJ0741522.1 hypothetical protein [Pedobacter montanisoli]
MKRYLVIFGIFILFASCNNNSSKNEEKLDTISLANSAKDKDKQQENTISVSGNIQQDSVFKISTQILSYLKQQNYEAFSLSFHPQKGVLFSPYGFIDIKKSKRLLAKDFLESILKNWTLTWGVYDGSGEIMQLKVIPYLNKFVYNVAFEKAPQKAFNKIIKQGNTKSNLKELFPEAVFVEYHFDGFDKALNGMDWQSLRLVFEKFQDQYYLVAIVHDQWTA